MEKRGFRPKDAADYAGLSSDWLKRARIYGHVYGIPGPRFHQVSPRLKIHCPKGRAGSTPAASTTRFQRNSKQAAKPSGVTLGTR